MPRPTKRSRSVAQLEADLGSMGVEIPTDADVSNTFCGLQRNLRSFFVKQHSLFHMIWRKDKGRKKKLHLINLHYILPGSAPCQTSRY